MLKLFRNSRAAKLIASFVIINLLVEILAPLKVYALTSGPSQPEVQSFEPVGTNQMVDLFTGDFTYNIPLLDVGGYPINISYHAGVGMDQEASWVGLGWNINPGVINRDTRGIPDDFNGVDKIKRQMNFKPNWTMLLKTNIGDKYKEYFGTKTSRFKPWEQTKKNDFEIGVYYNNYRGVGFDLNYKRSFEYNASLNVGYNTSNGINIEPSFNYKSVGLAFGYNSTYGAQYLAANLSVFSKPTDENLDRWNGRFKYSKSGHSVSSVSYFNPSYMPTSTPGMFSSSYDLNLKFGRVKSKGRFTARKVDANLSVYGIREDHKEREEKAYGYFYMENAGDDGLMDFNRDHELTPHKRLEYLPTTVLTHDIYSVSGQGTGGIFRPYRSRVGIVGDPEFRTVISSPNVGLGPELGISPFSATSYHLGLDLKTTLRSASSKKWDAGIFNNYSYAAPGGVGEDYESWYFKSAGEKTLIDEDFYDKIGKDKPIRVELDGANLRNTKYSLEVLGEGLKTPATIAHTKREKRNQPIFSFNADNSNYCVQKNIQNYYTNANGQVEVESIARLSNTRKGHHISEITSTNLDGSRYIYGLPAYNTLQKEVVFAIDNTTRRNQRNEYSQCINKGQVTYSTGDNTINNNLGIDNYFSSTETPPFAHSYLLTAVLSPDFVDIDDNGPTDNDLGNYTKFNYSRVSSNYRWRAPYSKSSNKANLLEGNKSDPTDDKAQYVYGEKEIWYLYSVETKTHIAEFILNDPITEPRQDGLDAGGEDGGQGDSKLRYLKKIVLYTKEDRLINGINAKPVKIINFEYDYSLCPKVENNAGSAVTVNEVDINAEKGKLTLKKIWFTYGNTTQGALSPYEFTYSSENYSYNSKAVDRWGVYKPYNCSDKNNDDFPYTEQDKTNTDKYVSAWNLTQIKLPSGGVIEVKYESDDYAYVQDKQAMEMFKVIGVGTTSNFSDAGNLLYEHGFQKKTNRYIFFELPPGVNSANIKEKLSPDGYGIYFKFLVDLDNKGHYEYVSGYAKQADGGLNIGVDNSAGYDVGFAYIDEADLSDNNAIDVNPISKAAWQKTRVELPHLVHPETDKFKSGSSDVGHVAKALFGVIPRISKMVTGINLHMLTKLFGQKIKLDGYSVIRLKTPNKKKLGGGHRVKQILLHDEWNEMTGEETQTTGQVYDYSKTDDITGETISSGVASYEPILGGEENPHKFPLTAYEEKRFLAVNDIFHLEGPIGESFYPGPSVGYSKVTVRNITPADLGLNYSITRHGTGKSVHEFYTAYDFPVVSERFFDRKEMNVGDFNYSQLLSLAGIGIDYKAATQGFSIILNDMHGKPKAKYDYAQGDNQIPISYVKYKYRVFDNNVPQKRLNNSVTVLNRDGTIAQSKAIGIESELVFDTQKDEEYGGSLGFEPNLNLVGTGPTTPPVPVPTFFFNYSNFYTRHFRRVSATKLINMYGILEEVEVKEDGAVIITKNVAYDAETGEVLLTHTQNEYSDDIYNFTYPAHWAYEGMGPAYLNTGLIFNSGTITNGYATVTSSVYEALSEGDELGKIDGPALKAWVLKKVGSNQVLLIDKDGLPITGSHQFKVFRSGRRNLQNTPIGSIVSNNNPVDYTNNVFAQPGYFGNAVINASATEFSDKWQLYTDKISFSKGRGTYSTIVQGANTYAGFIKNMIFSDKLLTDGEIIENHVNYPAPNVNNRAEKEFYALKLGIINSPLNTGDPTPSLSTLEWDIYSTSNNTLYSTINCFSSGGSTCNNDKCSLSIKIYEPVYGGLINHNINQLLPTLTFNTADNVDGNGNISGNYTVSYTYGAATGTFNFTLKATNGKTYRFDVTVSCFDYSTINGCIINYEGTQSRLVKDNLYNPFVWNVRGNWSPQKSLVYYDTRDNYSARASSVQNNNFNYTNMRVDGRLNNFIPYWYKETNQTFWTPEYKDNNYTPWTWNSELTTKDPFGLELETKNALNIYSSAIYSNNHTMPIAVASNAKLNQICYDGFEEPQNLTSDFDRYHFKFLYDIYKNTCTSSCPPKVGERARIVNTAAHTGLNSVEILKTESGDNSDYFSLGGSLSILTAIAEVNWQWPAANTTSQNNTDPNFSKVQESNVVKTFGPETGDYIVSYWVKEADQGALSLQVKYLPQGFSTYNSMVNGLSLTETSCNSNSISTFNVGYDAYYLEKAMDINNIAYNPYSNIATTLLSNNTVINGWRRIELKFTVPSNATTLKINFINTSASSSAYIDDVRIYPYDANMKTYAFDYFNRRLMAELDENNYATFYEYDDMGNLVRLKRETEKGIVTINENRQNIKK